MRASFLAAAALMVQVSLVTGLSAAPAAEAKSSVAPRATISVTNYTDGETIRYPVPLISGTLADAAATAIEVDNTSSTRDARQMRGLAHKGRFKALAELVPGPNKLVLRSGKAEMTLTLVYQPQTTPYFVRCVYLTDSSGATEFQTPIENDPQDYAGKLDTAMKLMQAFTAERNHDLGFGRRTFNLELDDSGKVKVHVFRGSEPAAFYYAMNDTAWWDRIAGELQSRLPARRSKTVAIAAYTRFDPATKKVRGHTALGGGDLALFGSGNFFTWPNRLADAQAAFMDTRPIDPDKSFNDSVGRNTFWGAASTTIGATLHELAHTFGLPHTRDPLDIMSRGFDRFNRAFTLVEPPSGHNPQPIEFPPEKVAAFTPVSAAALVLNRWFSMDAPPPRGENHMTAEVDEVGQQLLVKSDRPVRYVGFDVRGDAVYHVVPPAESKQVTVALADVRKHAKSDTFAVRVIDDQGNVMHKANLGAQAAPAARPGQTVFYVAPAGADSGDGSQAKPFATFARARQAVRDVKAKAQGPVTVRLRGGTYYLKDPVSFKPEDSGTAQAPIVYAAADGERVVISGGARLDLKWTDYKNGILQADVPGVKEGRVDFDQLFLDGVRQHMARYPNYDPSARNYGGTAADAIAPERVKRWASPAGAFLHALHLHEWGDFHYRITGVDEKGQAKLEGGWQNNRRMGMHPKYRFVENVFEELDAPGEWYLDHAKGVLYFMPPKGADMAKARVEAAGLRDLFEFRGTEAGPVRFITLKGLTLTHTARTFMDTREPLLRSDWTIYRGGAVFMEGTEDCTIADCFFDAVGGNAVFVNNYNRRAAITGCKITDAGASGVCFVGDPAAVRSAQGFDGPSIPYDKMDTTPGPKTGNYPAQCRVHDCLIHTIGRFEKQTAGVQIAMAEEIAVSHCSIYDVPRAGINIGDGCWGGHLLEFNDVFDTVKETGDHGSFNSWGRDRYWGGREPVNRAVAKDPEMPFWDARKTTVIRNNRWRCDHGWDIDLDDGSSNYHIYNNLCLNGGLKLREGFRRTVENNVMVNNSFHPHVWYDSSGDVFARNIVQTFYRPIGMPKVWGKEVDYNLLPDAAALGQSRAMGMDEHSAAGDAMFTDPAGGDYRVRDGSPALALGFKNFPMDQFGVVSPALRAEAKTPQLPVPGARAGRAETPRDAVQTWLGAKAKSVTNLGEVSAAGLPGEVGAILLEVPADSPAARSGLQKLDVILQCGGKPVKTLADLLRLYRAAPPGQKAKVEVFRGQKSVVVEVPGPGEVTPAPADK